MHSSCRPGASEADMLHTNQNLRSSKGTERGAALAVVVHVVA